MNIQELNYVLCIAKHQNLTRASKELYITQPTLSKLLKKLEKEAGGKLFNYDGGRFVPTYLGRRYLEYARRMLEVNKDWERERMDINACESGELNIVIPLMRSSCMIPDIMPEFHRKYPGIRINLYEETHDIQEKLLKNDELDLAIFNEARPDPQLQYEELEKEEILLMLPPGHPLWKKAEKRKGLHHPWLDLRLLKDEPFLLHYPDLTTGDVARKLFHDYEIDPPVLLCSRNTGVLAELCYQGLGAAFIPGQYVSGLEFEESPLYFSVGENGTFSHLTAAYRKDTYLPAYAREFIRLAKESVSE